MRLFESSDVAGGEQSAHLGDGDVVQGPQALRLREWACFEKMESKIEVSFGFAGWS